MNNLFSKIMFIAVAAMAFASCSNDEIYVAPETEGFEVSINANTTDTTRSAFGEYNGKTYPTLWDGDETWFAAINDKYTESISTIIFSDDLKSANANFTLESNPTASADGTYTLYALSPASAWSSYDYTKDYLRFYIARNIQTPTAVSCDPASQVLFAKSEAMYSADSFDVNFEHLSAYVKFSFTNVAEGGIVNSVSVTSEDVNLAGRYQYIPSTGALAEYDRLEKSITLLTNSVEDLWLAVAPVDVSGKVLTFSITTDKGILSRDVTMPATAKFESGKVATFNVDMAGIEYPTDEDAETWQLITNLADITDGEYLIAGKSQAGNIIYLPSTTTTSSAPSQKIISVPGLDLSSTNEFKTALIPDDARFTFSGSSSEMTITNAEGNYLYANNANNGLRIGSTECAWEISANTNNASALVFKASTSARYISVYKSQDWRSYDSVKPDAHDNNGASGSTFLYKKITNDPAISAAAIEVEATGGEGEASYSVMNMVKDDVIATSTDEWITVLAGDGIILYEVEPNYTGDARTGKITLSSASTGVTKDVAVTQAADELKVSNAVVSLDAEANSTATFTVTSTYDATISVDDAARWSVSPTNIVAGTTEITVTALTANEGEEAIEGAITITRTADSKSIEVAITQNAATTATTAWSLVDNASDLKAGDVLIFYSECTQGTFVAGDISSSVMSSVPITVGDEGIINLPDGTVELTLGGSAGAWTFSNSDGKLLGATAAKKLAWGSGTTTWTISIAANGDATIQNGTQDYGRFLYNANSPRFTTYTSATSSVMLLPQIYKKN